MWELISDPSQGGVFLGSIYVPVAGSKYHQGKLSSGQKALLIREPANGYDKNAIRVVDAFGQAVGHLPRGTARWLAPLIDHDQVAVDVSESRTFTPRTFVGLNLYLLPAGLEFLMIEDDPQDYLAAMHQMILELWNRIQLMTSQKTVREVGKHLIHLEDTLLWPETWLLLRLIRCRGRDLEMRPEGARALRSGMELC